MTNSKVTLEEYLENHECKFMRLPRFFKEGARVLGCMWEAIEGPEEFQVKGDPDQIFITLFFVEEEKSILIQETRYAMSMMFPVQIEDGCVLIDTLDLISTLRKFYNKLPVDKEPLPEILEFLLYSSYYGYNTQQAQTLSELIVNATYLSGRGEVDEEEFNTIVDSLYNPPKSFYTDKYIDQEVIDTIEVQETVYDLLPTVLYLLRKHLVQDQHQHK
ncbi:hypothetical protein KMW28_16955 [Flammeovirga yaeyamensis]|uniref:Uncharacterized protein n=1 Tax=Flammeovirga yaeyamensis TaxID=367791 RepID=A0AAX1N167_9BACT|nr:hypothetical protein [Flammeovirga yaeyamensis]MBB3698295.1 hypothetical protein [Flammeovirga yaeyamensis]NMF34352.1 hypothetical protein [Flammeovirga yaeyamensis]QWG01333.1 hypothetical protein KMW28_16955 [Flammeovirga yaeyamensis]